MTTLRHGYNNPQPDDGDPDVTGPDEWNDDHVSDHAFVMVGAIPASLTGARSLAVSGGFLSLTDAGAGGAITIGLAGSSILHNLLSATHPDTDPSSPVRGGIITAQGATPKWTQLSIGTNTRVVKSDGTDVVWGQVLASEVGSGAALTRVNDTNVTLTLAGTPGSALLAATSMTLGWSGQLAASRGGTGVSALGDITKVNDTNVTLTLGGTPTGAVITSTSFTLGWTGLLGLARGGTHADLSATGGAGQYLKQVTTGADITVGVIPASDIGSGAALTRVNDTNVTVTLGGAPATALLAATSLTLGWAGTLAIARGGTGQATATAAFDALSPLTTRGDLLTRDASNNVRLAVGASGRYIGSNGTDPAWNAPGALTKTDDTNVTLTLGGTPASALLVAASLTLGWTGTLAVARGGIGIGTLASNGVLYGNGTGAVQTLAVNATATNQFLRQVSSGAPAWAAIAAGDLPGSFSGFANPTGSIGLAIVNGSATTAMRSDGAPALSQTISPNWTGTHQFLRTSVVTSGTDLGTVFGNAFSPPSGGLTTVQGVNIQTNFNPSTGVNISTAYNVGLQPIYQGAGTVTNGVSLGILAPTYTTKPTNTWGLFIANMGASGITTSVALDIGAQGNSTTNFGIRNASNLVQTGYARFGGVTVPSNVTDGDVTLIRVFGGSGAWTGGHSWDTAGNKPRTLITNGINTATTPFARVLEETTVYSPGADVAIQPWFMAPTFSPTANVTQAYVFSQSPTLAPAAGITLATTYAFSIGLTSSGTGILTTVNIGDIIAIWSGPKPTTVNGLQIRQISAVGVTTASAISITKPAGATNNYYFSFDTDDATLPVGFAAHRLKIQIAGAAFNLPVVA